MKPDHNNVIELIHERKELQKEFFEALLDHVPALSRDIATLRKSPDDTQTIDNLFRTAHNIKGDAATCQVQLAVDIMHPIETLLDRLRKREFSFDDIIAEAVTSSVERLESAIEHLVNYRSIEHLRMDNLKECLIHLADAPLDELTYLSADLIEKLSGYRPKISTNDQNAPELPPNLCQSKPEMLHDLEFFRSFAEFFEMRSPQFKGRTIRLLHLANKTNEERKYLVNPEQLEAAIYMHDIGMMFLPESIWLKEGKMSEEERELLRRHSNYATGLLSRMESWGEAAKMVAQHHEMVDGKGYPHGLAAAEICDGAKLIAIVDAFESVMLKHASQGKSRSILRAVAEVNASDKHFDPEWTRAFNVVIRQLADKNE